MRPGRMLCWTSSRCAASTCSRRRISSAAGSGFPAAVLEVATVVATLLVRADCESCRGGVLLSNRANSLLVRGVGPDHVPGVAPLFSAGSSLVPQSSASRNLLAAGLSLPALPQLRLASRAGIGAAWSGPATAWSSFAGAVVLTAGNPLGSPRAARSPSQGPARLACGPPQAPSRDCPVPIRRPSVDAIPDSLK